MIPQALGTAAIGIGRRPSTAAAVVAAAGLAVALAGWGTLPLGPAPKAAHPVELDGSAWVELSLEERELLVQGFVLGAATERALARGVASSDGGNEPPDARAVSRAVTELRAGHGLPFPLAPSLLARRVDEYYWWRNNREVPLSGALAEVNGGLRGGGR